MDCIHKMNYIYLTRRNLQTLINKLDRHATGDTNGRTIIKYDTTHPKYPASTVTVVSAVENEEYYKDRTPGDVHHKDQPN